MIRLNIFLSPITYHLSLITYHPSVPTILRFPCSPSAISLRHRIERDCMPQLSAKPREIPSPLRTPGAFLQRRVQDRGQRASWSAVRRTPRKTRVDLRPCQVSRSARTPIAGRVSEKERRRPRRKLTREWSGRAGCTRPCHHHS